MIKKIYPNDLSKYKIYLEYYVLEVLILHILFFF
jgi:hypothetical protein